MSEALAAAQNKTPITNLESWAANNKVSTSLAEFYTQNKEYIPPAWHDEIENLVLREPKAKIPKIEIQKFRDTNGKPATRILVKDDGGTYYIEDMDGDQTLIKVNDQRLNEEDFSDAKLAADKITHVIAQTKHIKEVNPTSRKFGIISAKDFYSMSKRGRAYYLYRLRYIYDALFKLQNTLNKNEKSAFNWIPLPVFLLQSETAQADVKVGQPCIFAGWLTTYGQAKGGAVCSLIATKQLQQYPPTQNCGSGNIACNPYVYGYQRAGQGKSAICVTADNHATENCGGKSPIDTPEDKLALIKSVEENLNVNLLAGGKVSPDDYKKLEGFLSNLQDHIQKSREVCKDLTSRPDQIEACDALEKRLINFETVVCQEMAVYQPSSLCPATPPKPPPALAIKCVNDADPHTCACVSTNPLLYDVNNKICTPKCRDTSETQRGSTCDCADGYVFDKTRTTCEQDKPSDPPPPVADTREKKKDTSFFGKYGLAIGAALVVVAGTTYAFTRHGKKRGRSVVPLNPIVGIGTTSIVIPPTMAPPPMPPTSEGGPTTNPTTRAGGVRTR